ncbi:Uncharacterised protein [Mycobacteroides abscessus subsp. abscessus]|nr:Uncharacterised protein [Mycobacteroides abscessus subsp. abscessus]
MLQSYRSQIVREHSHAVAAHLGDRTVGIAVVHEPVFAAHPGRFLGQDPALQGSAYRGHAQHAIGAETALPVAQRLDGCHRQVAFDVDIRQHHEIVLGAVPLGELHVFEDRRQRDTISPASPSGPPVSTDSPASHTTR